MVGSTEYQLLASASRTANPTLAPASWDNQPEAEGILVVANITNAGTGSITVAIEGWDPGAGAWFTLLASAALTTNQTKTLLVYPSTSDSANARAAMALPKRYRVTVTHNNANAITYSVGAILLAE